MAEDQQIPEAQVEILDLERGQSSGIIEDNTKGKVNKPRLAMKKKDNPNLRLAELGMRGTGFVKSVKEQGFGFINTPELDEHLFFHASEFLRPEEDNDKPFVDCVVPGDEVEFVVGQNTGARMNLVAQKVQKLPPNTVKAQILSEDCYQGRVVKELNSGSWRSEDSSVGQISFQCKAAGNTVEDRLIDFHTEDVFKLRQALKKGTAVQFFVCTDNQTRAQRAVHLEVVMDVSSNPAEVVLHGFIRELNKIGGVIRCIEVEKRFQFKIAELSFEAHSGLAKGQPVMFTLLPDPKASNGRVSSVVPLPEGSLSAEKSLGKVQGRIARALAKDKPKENGLIFTSRCATARGGGAIFDFESGADPSLDMRQLQVDDEVEFELEDRMRLDVMIAKQIRLLCRGTEKRELGQVRTKKSNFGFIVCCQRSGQLFFHSSALDGCTFEDLKKGDDVEFSVERHPERGTMAVRVRRVPQGSAVFETVSEARHSGQILTPPALISHGVTSSGVLEFEEDGKPAKLLFGVSEFKDEVRTGDYATFQIADNVKAAKQVASLGSTVSRMTGRRAVLGELLKYSGTVRQALQGFGYIKYTDPSSNSDKRITFASHEVVNQVELNSGDEVTFILTKSSKLMEDVARRVTRTKEAPVSKPDSVPNPSPKPLNTVPQVMKTPAMPDGTRGFQMGRGGYLPTPPPNPTAAPPTTPQGGNSAQTRVPGKLLVNGQHARLAAMSLSGPDGQMSQTGRQDGSPNGHPDPAERRRLRKPRAQKAQAAMPSQPEPITLQHKPLIDAVMQRTSSGRTLNPHAVEFQPRDSGLQPANV